MTRFWIGLVALLAATAIGTAPAEAQGKSGNKLKPIIGSFGQGHANAGGLGNSRGLGAGLGNNRRLGAGQGDENGGGQGNGRAIGLGNAKSGVPGGILSGGTNLPPGLAKMSQLPPGLFKMNQLPPGLAKQLEKNGRLPPGLEVRGLPDALAKQLPDPGEGRKRVVVDNDVVLIDTQTGRVLDILKDVLGSTD
ncbi:MAG: hypothetical protein IIB67_02290 [Proteobacteria bacterium]|nr:hypothetical protein [Pseudomonadota bacterium]